ncbi:hypothetical protein [Bradyrhizobium sp. McL0616]|uniref:hypothetical protein n=1 Tax=Bradyrhizobium sp. McL0616 TaxID=3415674 RepID=UPI003CF6F05F
MIIPTHFGPAGPLWRAEAFKVLVCKVLVFKVLAFNVQAFNVKAWRARAFSRLVSPDLMAVDLRVAFASVVTRSLVQAADALVRHFMGRAWRGARFAKDITTAATMVAAVGR